MACRPHEKCSYGDKKDYLHTVAFRGSLRPAPDLQSVVRPRTDKQCHYARCLVCSGCGAPTDSAHRRLPCIGVFRTCQVGTVGAIKLHPNLINVIAARATVTVDLRNTDERALQHAERELAEYLVKLAEDEQVQIESKSLARFEPVIFDQNLVRRIENAAAARGLSHRRITSGAGHDAQMMARICPAAMIFVPSQGGISHNAREYTSPADLTSGANVLLDALCALTEVVSR